MRVCHSIGNGSWGCFYKLSSFIPRVNSQMIQILPESFKPRERTQKKMPHCPKDILSTPSLHLAARELKESLRCWGRVEILRAAWTTQQHLMGVLRGRWRGEGSTTSRKTVDKDKYPTVYSIAYIEWNIYRSATSGEGRGNSRNASQTHHVNPKKPTLNAVWLHHLQYDRKYRATAREISGCLTKVRSWRQI